MKSREYYISLILSHAEELKSNFGVKSLRLFGSVSRNEQKEGSDVDICVDMEPKMFLVVRLKRFLENLLECSVDIVRIHKRINPYLLKEIEHDGIYIIKRIAGTLLQIKKAIEQLQDWNKDIQNVDDYYSTPEGMKNLAASCMLIEAIGEGVKQIDKLTQSRLLDERPEIP